jgi:hypothetical protein
LKGSVSWTGASHDDARTDLLPPAGVKSPSGGVNQDREIVSLSASDPNRARRHPGLSLDKAYNTELRWASLE